MKILVVSGFLGAGKTTFIKNLITKTNVRPVILENEYGDDNLDSQVLNRASDLQIYEFMEGCVCCSKKDSFKNTLLTISASLDPEYIIVEPSGVGKLSNILSNIEQISYEKIECLNPILVISPRQIDEYLSKYSEVYLDQIKNAGIIVLSKIENYSKEMIEKAKNKITRYNKNAVIIDTPYQNMDNSFFNELFKSKSDIEIREENDNNLKLDQYTTSYPNIRNIPQLIMLLEDVVHKRYGDIVRAKGELLINNERIRFDLADNLYGIVSVEDDIDNQQCVFIGQNIDKKKLDLNLNIKNKKIDYVNMRSGIA